MSDESIWMECLSLAMEGEEKKRWAYKITYEYIQNFLVQFQTKDSSINYLKEHCFIRTTEFWNFIRDGFLNSDSLTRKRAVYTLKAVLNASLDVSPSVTFPDSDAADKNHFLDQSQIRENVAGEKQILTKNKDKRATLQPANKDSSENRTKYGRKERWESFILLLETLDEYAFHLAVAAWPAQIEILLPNSSETVLWYGTSCDDPFSNLDVNYAWMEVIWAKGLSHRNPQVRRMVLDSFLERSCYHQEYIRAVSESFVLGPLLKGLNDPIQHQEFGMKGSYTSKTAVAATKFFTSVAEQHSDRSRLSFLSKFAAAAALLAPCRSGLMTVSLCIASLAAPSLTGGDGKKSPHVGDSDDLEGQALNNLRLVVEDAKRHFNPNYRAKIYYHILEALESTVDVGRLELPMVAALFDGIPVDLLKPGGLLHELTRQWLTRSRRRASDGSLQDPWLMAGLRAMLYGSFETESGSGDGEERANEAEMERWRLHFMRWCKLLRTAVPHGCQSEIISQDVRKVLERVWMATESSPVPQSCKEKSLLLLESLTAFWSPKERQGSVPVSEADSWPSGGSDEAGESIALIITPLLDSVSRYAEDDSLLFWEDSRLPYSQELPGHVTGQLGGPSQRRLSEAMSSVVVSKILSIKVVSECYLWLWLWTQQSIQLSSTVPSFLWTFAWTFVDRQSSESCQLTEVQSELRLAALEALVPVSRALSACGAGVPAGLGPFAIDSLAMAVETGVESVLKRGSLARSRRAVFESHKWACLEALVSFPVHESASPTHVSAVQCSSLKLILEDAADSLERVGEDHMLPLLQCIRCLLSHGAADSQDGPQGGHGRVATMSSLVRAGWSAIVDANKRKVAPLAALLSAMVHPVLFSDPSMHSEASSPLKWLLHKLMELGCRSPRTMRLTALHWTGMWLKHPQIARLYVSELKTLSLHGADAVDEELDGEIGESGVAAHEYALLAQSSDGELLEIFTNSEMYARVAVAIMMHQFSVSPLQRSDKLACGRSLLIALLEAAVQTKELSKELYKKKSTVHRRKVRVWQMLCILSPFLEESLLPHVCELLEKAIERNNMPSVRQYVEVFAAQVYLQFPSLVKQHLSPLIQQHNMKTQALSSYVVVAFFVILHAQPLDCRNQAIHELFPAVLPSMTSHHHNLRSYCQVLIHHVLSSLPNFNFGNSDARSADSPPCLDSACLQILYNYLDTNLDCTRLRVSVQPYLNAFDPVACCHPRGLFTTNMAGEIDPSRTVDDIPFECVPLSVYDRVVAFLQETRESLRESMASDSAFLSMDAVSKRKDLMAMSAVQSSDQPLEEANWDFQRKVQGSRLDLITGASLPSENEEDEDLMLCTAASRAEQLSSIQGQRQGLIVVASLIARIPNLAGLARTCEVFKASSLVLADMSVIQDRQFQQISVTAEKWIPLFEVPESGLPLYLEMRKKEGYVLVGLEQTANSVPIHEYKFPQKTVLVLGREKEGIPLNIIQILDSCVEIPQMGLIRSLNVHVSGAIATWEFTRQHLS